MCLTYIAKNLAKQQERRDRQQEAYYYCLLHEAVAVQSTGVDHLTDTRPFQAILRQKELALRSNAPFVARLTRLGIRETPSVTLLNMGRKEYQKTLINRFQVAPGAIVIGSDVNQAIFTAFQEKFRK